MAISMRRNDLQHIDCSDCQHAGLLLERGFKQWDNNGEKHNSAIFDLHKTAAKITEDNLQIYGKAYEDWKSLHINNSNSEIWFGQLENRMFLGMGEVSPVEAGITLHHTYGVPYIPGSAIKGVLKHYAHEIELDKSIQEILFGKEANPNDKNESGDAGYIIFNDAWWIPQGKALVPEIITVHTQKYYASEGRDTIHPDFESPNPNPQIAIQGSFLFTVEGGEQCIKCAIELLTKAMENKGVGAKSASGYGYFSQDTDAKNSLDEEINRKKEELEEISKEKKLEQKKSHMSPIAGEFYEYAQKNNWETDKNAFWSLGERGIETWLDKLEENNDKELRHQIEMLMEIHFKGVMENPDKTTGKKDKPVFKPRVQKIARRLIALR